jgi:uncharacterized repeat protein (TIGR03803 family)
MRLRGKSIRANLARWIIPASFSRASLKGVTMDKRARLICIRLLFSAVSLIVATSSSAQTEKILYTFTGSNDGGLPQSGVVFDAKGNLYGTSEIGAAGGLVYELTPNSNGTWSEAVLYNFTFGFGDGEFPIGGLTFDGKGNLYGTTNQGGVYFQSTGTVFELLPGAEGVWSEKVLYSFSGGSDGGNPYAGVTMDSAGNLFGVTTYGGSQNSGTVFELVAGANDKWTEKVLHSFTGGNDGGQQYGQLVADSSGNFYGTTLLGGAHDYGAVFEMSLGLNGIWSEKIVHSFTGGAGGAAPFGNVVFDKSGNLYTEANSSLLELTPSSNGTWTPKTIHNFVGGPDGAVAECGLAFDKSGNLYVMTNLGGQHKGTVFELTPGSNGSWTEKVLHKFAGGSDGAFPEFANLAIDASGNVYGTTPTSGASNRGVVFQVKP